MEAHACSTYHCEMIVALGKVSKDNIKTELYIVVRSIMNIKSQDLRRRSKFL